MKRVFTAVVIFALAAGSAAQAEDQFKGFYVGFNVGGVGGRSDARTTTVAGSYFDPTSPPAIAIAGAQDLSGPGFTGGGQAGYNFQSGKFVFGLEADFGVLKWDKSRSTTAVYPCCAPETFTIVQSVKTDWLFTARPRIGYASENWLVYVTGGVAATNLNYRADFSDTFTGLESGRNDERRIGWTVGGGVEYQFKGGHWSMKGEYLFADFGAVSMTSTNLTCCGGAGTFPDTPFTHRTDFRAHIYRLGVNYRF